MARKEDLLKEVYRLMNMIAEVEGKAQTDIEQYAKTWKFVDEVKNSRVSDLEMRITRLNEQHQRVVEKKERKERTAAYFATPEGAARKDAIENEIDAIRQEWEKNEQTLVAQFEANIQQTLGEQWGVCRYVKGCLCIGVIDAEKSTPERREFFFGQTFDITYDERPWGIGQEKFETNIGSCGSCSMTGGQTVGERAFFYIGIGRLFTDQVLLEYLRTTMRDAARSFENASKKVCDLQRELQDPTQK